MTLKSIFACPFRFAFLLLPIAGWCLTALPVAATETVLADKLEEKLKEPFHGDLDALIERGIIRVLIPFSKTGYFIDKGVQRGINADLMVEFSKHLDKKHGKKTTDVKVFLVPTSHERLFTDLAQGRGDLALGYLTVTQDREKLAAFSIPLLKDAREVPVTADSVADFTSPHDLSGRTVYVHKSASYFQSLVALNRKLSGEGGKTVQVVSVDERLEEEDLLEMVAAGAVPAIIADQNKAKLWIDVLEGLKMHPQAAVRTDGEIAIAVRKKAPGLLKEVNDFARTVQEGTLLGNIIFKRYLKDADYLKALHKGSYDENLTEFHAVFEKYAAKYNFDCLLIAAQSFQESRFDPKARSRAGAVGLMQIMPSTAAPPPGRN